MTFISDDVIIIMVHVIYRIGEAVKIAQTRLVSFLNLKLRKSMKVVFSHGSLFSSITHHASLKDIFNYATELARQVKQKVQNYKLWKITRCKVLIIFHVFCWTINDILCIDNYFTKYSVIWFIYFVIEIT